MAYGRIYGLWAILWEVGTRRGRGAGAWRSPPQSGANRPARLPLWITFRTTSKIAHTCGMNRWQSALAASAASHDGVILATDLRRSGVSERHLDTITRGLMPVRRGAYVAVPPLEELASHLNLARAAFLQHSSEVALSHISAAAIYGFPLVAVDLQNVHISAIEHRIRGGRRNRVHTHVSPLNRAEIVHQGELAVTTPLRTVVDCALMLPLDSALVIADFALHSGLISMEQLRTAVSQLPRRAGIAIARSVAAFGDPLAESPGETRTRLIIVQGGYEVDSQVEILDDQGFLLGRVDLHLREHPVVIEFDGRMKYGMNGDVERAHWEEKRRHDRIEETGRVVVRVVWEELAAPTRVLAKVQRAIRRAQRASGH